MLPHNPADTPATLSPRNSVRQQMPGREPHPERPRFSAYWNAKIAKGESRSKRKHSFLLDYAEPHPILGVVKNSEMIPLNLPPYAIKIAEKNGRTAVFDPLRRRYVCLTPEEWVRQHFTNYLISHKGYPAALLANEVSLCVGGASRRCDSVLYHHTGGRPRVIIEYKAPSVAITQAVFTQIASYNSVLRADYLIVSNGLAHYCCRIDYNTANVEYLTEIPDYSDLIISPQGDMTATSGQQEK